MRLLLFVSGNGSCTLEPVGCSVLLKKKKKKKKQKKNKKKKKKKTAAFKGRLYQLGLSVVIGSQLNYWEYLATTAATIKGRSCNSSVAGPGLILVE